MSGDTAILAYAKCGCIFAASWDGADPVRAAEFIKGLSQSTLAALRFMDDAAGKDELRAKMRRHDQGYADPELCPYKNHKERTNQ